MRKIQCRLHGPSVQTHVASAPATAMPKQHPRKRRPRRTAHKHSGCTSGKASSSSSSDSDPSELMLSSGSEDSVGPTCCLMGVLMPVTLSRTSRDTNAGHIPKRVRLGATVNDGTSASGPVTSHSLVTDDNVRAALTADKGPNARLTEWKVVDFTKKGDNYACAVSSVEVKYELDGLSSEVVYVVKLNPYRNDEISGTGGNLVYEKEAKFYCNLVPELNAVLKENDQREINFPKCLYVSLETGKEIIYLEDLRPRGYKMHDMMHGMDTLHTNLVLRELARLHAASLLLEKKYPGENLTEKYPCLKRNWSDLISEVEPVQKLIKGAIEFTQSMLEVYRGYQRAVVWIDTLITKLKDVFFEQMECGKPKVVCHGDCWNNNLLFKYDEAGHPVDVMLLDLQVVQYTPPATDLSYLLYTTTTRDFRKLNFQGCLESYHNALTDIMKTAGQEVPFDLEQFTKDVKEKALFGAIFAMMGAAPMNTKEGVEVMFNKVRAKFDTMNTFDSETMTRHTLLEMREERLLSLLDEMMELGVIS